MEGSLNWHCPFILLSIAVVQMVCASVSVLVSAQIISDRTLVLLVFIKDHKHMSRVVLSVCVHLTQVFISRLKSFF